MASLIFAGDTSGSITIAAPASAGSGTLTLPVATDTLVGKATTDTLTNKTLTAVALGTPASGVLTNCTGVVSAAMPAGSVLQVVMGTYAIDTSTTSASFVTTGLSASITPRSTSSKILVLYTGTYFVTVSSKGVKIQITRAATSIYAPSNYNLYSSAIVLAQQTLSYLDSPVTTSATTYAINFATPDGSAVRVQYDNNQSTITLMEIQG